MEDDCAQKPKVNMYKRPTQHINPVFVFELSIVLLCSQQWPGRFGMLSASVCLRVQRPPSQRRVSRVSLLVTAQTLSHGFSANQYVYDHHSSPDLMIRLEGHLCSIYCVSIWFQPRGKSHSFCQHRRRGARTDLQPALTNTPRLCPTQQWLFSSPAAKY